MTDHLYLLIGPTLYLLLFWYVYILVMGLYRAWLAGRLKGIPLVLATPALLIGWLMDLLANIFIATVIFLELPSKPLELVTGRLTRYLTSPEDHWRTRVAKVICTNLLDVFDPSGEHCKP